MTVYIILTIIWSLLIVFLFLLAGNRYQSFIEANKKEFQITFLAPVSLYLIEKLRFIERFPALIGQIQRKMINLYGVKIAINYTIMFLAQLISTFILTLMLSFLFALVGEGDHSIFAVGLFVSIILPVFMYKKLEKQESERRVQILMDLPEFVNKLVLLINAGETVQQAIRHSVHTKKEVEKSPLYKELEEMVSKLSSNQPFNQVMEDFNKRCSIQEVSLFTSSVLLNYRKGGDDLVIALRQLSQDLWKTRKTLSKVQGEEASSKMLFPMMMIFIAIIIMIGWPAMSLM